MLNSGLLICFIFFFKQRRYQWAEDEDPVRGQNVMDFIAQKRYRDNLYKARKMAETIVPGGPQAWISSEQNLSDTKIVLRLWSCNEDMVWRTLVRAWVDDPGWLQQSERNSVNRLSGDSLCHNIGGSISTLHRLRKHVCLRYSFDKYII